MSPILRVLESTRLYLLVFTLPPAMVWFGMGGTTSEGVGFGAAGFLLVFAHSLLVLFHVTSFDAATLSWGGVPRLGMTGDRDHWDPDLVDRARMVYAALVGLVTAVLLFASWRSALVVLIALILIGWLTGGATKRSRKWRLLFAEVLWPGLMLLVPMVLAGWLVAARHAGLAELSPPVTGLFALLLAGYVLMCLVRDEALDLGEGQRTLTVALGRGGAVVVLFLLLSALMIVSSRGVEMGWWGWPVAAVSGVAGLAGLWGVAARDGEGMTGVWVLGVLVIGIAVLWA